MPDVPEELAASVQHLELLGASIAKAEARLEMLRAARAQTIKQIAAAAGRAKGWSADDQLALYEKIHGTGALAAWTKAGLPNPRDLRLYRPNDPQSGGWVGTFSTEGLKFNESPISRPRPSNGQAVVYVLYGPDLSPIYCGSTCHFHNRLKWHQSDGKVFVAWRAVPYDDRESAYQAEDRLLKESCPPRNRKASR
jgi:predicted GIY-YIG superfamily endonuclease